MDRCGSLVGQTCTQMMKMYENMMGNESKWVVRMFFCALGGVLTVARNGAKRLPARVTLHRGARTSFLLPACRKGEGCGARDPCHA